jgi:hypothetical protein
LRGVWCALPTATDDAAISGGDLWVARPGQPQSGTSEIEMKPGTGSRPLRDRNRKPHVPSERRAFGSHGTEGRVRGNAHQLLERYLGLSRDAQAAGDRIAAENYSQHAEHYFRVINGTAEGSPRSRHHQLSEGTAQPRAAAALTPQRALMNGSVDVLGATDPDNDESEAGSAPTGLV